MFVETIETKGGIVDAIVLGFLVSLLLAGLIAAGSATEHEIRTPEYSLDSSLLAYYPFNGNANDESGNGHHGTVYGATLTEDRVGNPNKAYLFDNPTTSDTNRIELSDENGFLGGETLESLSMSAWFLPYTQSDACSYILHLVSPEAASVLHFQSDGSVAFTQRTLDIGIFNQRISTQVSLDHWHHAVGTWNGSVMKLYVDGVLRAEAPFPWTLSKTPPGPGHAIGANPCPDPNNPAHVCSFNGKIDEVRLYNRALTAEEIKAQYDEEKLSTTEKILPVPYFNQGQTEWCTLTCGAMILQYYGVKNHPWDLAREFRTGHDETFWDWGELNPLTDNLENYMNSKGLIMTDYAVHRSQPDFKFETFEAVQQFKIGQKRKVDSA